jgi:hypothetical protein|tara:strand:- start:729 stop:953 length:225 start_codon:yes stop_codon:yes gene_type:complete
LWRITDLTYGIFLLVTIDNNRTVVPTELISNLISQFDGSIKLQSSDLLMSGDHVCVVNGSFANFIAQVENILPE